MQSLVQSALDAKYVSSSSHQGKRTGNRYQPIVFGEMHLRGARTPREDILLGLDLQGKKVLDLGSNLGEMSRIAREMGAQLVDGYEYDQYFIDIANLVNAAKGVTRVSFYQKDITAADSFAEVYDNTLAFSVFTYLAQNLERVAAVTKQFLVLETHKLEGNLYSQYILPVAQHFPYWVVYGETDVGAARSAEEKRAVILFHRRPGPIRNFVFKRARLLSPGNRGLSQLDLERSHTPFLSAFFKRFSSCTAGDVQSYLERAKSEYDAGGGSAAADAELQSGIRSSTYWCQLLVGLQQYLETGAVEGDNAYLACVKRLYREIQPQSSTAKLFADDNAAHERVTLRLRRAREMLCDRRELERDPVVVFEAPKSSPPMVLFEAGKSEPLTYKEFDGYHRVFFAKLLNLGTLPLMKVICSDSGYFED